MNEKNAILVKLGGAYEYLLRKEAKNKSIILSFFNYFFPSTYFFKDCLKLFLCTLFYKKHVSKETYM